MNTATIVGRVGRDASEGFKAFDSGKMKANFSVAVNRWDSKTKAEVTDWFNVEIWDRQAEFAAEYVKKGRLVAVDGSIANNRWVDKTTGTERESFLIRANTIKLLGSKRDAEEAL
ncbi:MAG: single-stranded DNA-binding protein [Muribaculaceae bacterium]|nr:single-stranded DNA-binding protein [Muribaculaceae bacterium]